VKKIPEQNARPNLLLIGVLVGLVVYLLLFLATTYEWPGEYEVARGTWVLLQALLPDELVGAWFESPSDLLLLDRILPLTVGLAICAVAGMLGYLTLVALRIDRRLSILEQIFFAEAAGLNLVSTYALAVGLIGGLHNRLWFILPTVVVGAVFAWTLWKRRGTKVGQPLPVNVEPPQSQIRWINHHWLWLGGLFAVLILLGGLLPPNEFDVREYHLQAPKEFYEAGSVHFLPHNIYGNMALGAEMHALVGMVLTGDWWIGALGGKAILALFAPLTALGLLAAGRRLFSPAVGILAAIIYISIPLIANISTFGFIEGAAAFYLFATLYAMLIIHGDGEARVSDWLLPGYLAGASVACKYPGLLFVVAPLGAWLLWLSFARRDEEGRRRPDWWAPVLFGVAVTLGCGLWLGKNWGLAGNPLYPLLYGLFGGETLTAEKSQTWNTVHRPAGFTLSALVTDAWRIFLSSDWLSPILIPLAALACFHRRRPLVIGLAAYFAFIVIAWWCLALRIDRYWAPGLPILALLAGAGAVWCRDRLWQRALLCLLIFASLFNFITAAMQPCIYPRLFVPYTTLRTSPERVNPWHLYLNEHVDGTVLMVGDAQVFDLEMRILYNTWLDDSIFESIFRDPASGELRPTDEICAELKSRNISHIYVSWREIKRYIDTDYGDWKFVQPQLFIQLIAEGVLEIVPPPENLEESPNQVYRVVSHEL
jgi:dolichyl-phosphate-mannose-protein mannosyltransferase